MNDRPPVSNTTDEAPEEIWTAGHGRWLDLWMQEHETTRLKRLASRYEALARAECRRQGIAPDELISDAGHAAWELVGYEAARKEMPDVE